MKRLVAVLVIVMVYSISNSSLYAQGCVAIRGLNGAVCASSNGHADSTSWTLTINTRYFKSYKHFVGTVEQKERLENQTEVINHSFSTDFFIQKKK